jgi:hypothetical protein
MHAENPSSDDGMEPKVEPEKSDALHEMEIADRIRPHIAKLYESVKDANGLPYRPSLVRGIALRMAKDLYQDHLKNVDAETAEQDDRPDGKPQGVVDPVVPPHEEQTTEIDSSGAIP